MSSNQELPDSYRQVFQTLKRLLEQVPGGRLRAKSPGFVEEFAYNYLRGLTILSHIKGNPSWHHYLQPCQRVLLQANVMLYPESGVGERGFLYWVWTAFPAQFWKERYFHGAAIVLSLLAAIVAFFIVRENFEMASVFVPSGLRESMELDAYLFSTTAQQDMLTGGRDISDAEKTVFAYQLWQNNSMVALQCFLRGFLFGVPTVVALIHNGLMLGALPALFYGGDLLGLGAWLLPHGVPELAAIFFAGGIGLRLGMTMLNPGDLSLGQAVKQVIRESTGTLVLCALMLIWAAIVESFVRQSHLGYATRYAIAGLSLIPLVFIFLRGFLACEEQQASSTEGLHHNV